MQYGVLGFRQFKASYAHNQKDLDYYQQVLNKVFDSIANDKQITNIDTPDHQVFRD